MNIIKRHMPSHQHFPEVHKKDLLVLHFTAGWNASGAINHWLTDESTVGAPYVVDNDGTVLETFDPRKWIWHLGLGKTWAHDKRSVAVEISNMGPLRLRGNKLCYWANNYTKTFCDVSETDLYVKLPKPWRTFQYFATYSEPQLRVLPALVTKICQEHGIPRVLPPQAKWDLYDLTYFGKWKGICSHQNFRSEKFDVGPAFPWKILL